MTERLIFVVFMTLIFILAATWLAKPISETVYFLVRDSADITAQTLGDIITITGGMPGEVKLHVLKPPADYTYILGIDKKIVNVMAMGTEEISLPEDIKSNAFTTAGITIDESDCKNKVFSKIIIEKIYGDELKIEIEC